LPVSFESVIGDDNCFMFSERDGEELNTELEINSVTAIVGSEGGWSDEELHQARAAGVSIVTLGGRVLRAETAAIATAVLLQHLYGDLK